MENLNVETSTDVALAVLDQSPALAPEQPEGAVFVQDEHYSPEEAGAKVEA